MMPSKTMGIHVSDTEFFRHRCENLKYHVVVVAVAVVVVVVVKSSAPTILEAT